MKESAKQIKNFKFASREGPFGGIETATFGNKLEELNFIWYTSNILIKIESKNLFKYYTASQNLADSGWNHKCPSSPPRS